MRTAAKIFICTLVFLVACKSEFETPTDQKAGMINLSLVPYCSFDENDISNSTKKQLALYPPGKKAIDIIARLQQYSGIEQDIQIFKGSVSNALATVVDGRKIIVYNENFIEEADTRSRSFFWQSMFILAHEIGHHLYNHHVGNDSSTRYQQELQADKFAGLLLYRLGAREEECVWIMKTSLLQDHRASTTHPPKDRRTAAIRAGWKSGFDQSFIIPIPPPPQFDSGDAENFFSDGHFTCGELLKDTFSFMGREFSGCNFDEVMSANSFLTEDSIFGNDVIRDTVTAVILSLDQPRYLADLMGFLEQTNVRIRIVDYNKRLNPYLTSRNKYVIELSNPEPSQGALNYFTQVMAPGQWIRCKLVVENSTSGVFRHRFSYLKFISSPNTSDTSFQSPFK